MSICSRLDHLGGDAFSAFQCADLGRGVVANRTCREIGRVVGVERLRVEIPWVALRQQEGLGGLSVRTDGRQIDARVASVVASAGEEEPSSVAAPVVEAVGSVAVDHSERIVFARLQIQEPKVTFGMPDGEIAIVGKGVHQIAPIVGGTWPADALPLGGSIDERIDLLSDVACGGIEAYAAEAVAFLIVVGRIDLPEGCNEIEPSAVG